MAFGDALTGIPHKNEREKYCDTNQVCRYLDVRREFEGSPDAYEHVFKEKPSKSWSLKRFASSFWSLKSTGSC